MMASLLTYGSSEAAVKVEVFLNLACPYCATFFEAADQLLAPYIANQEVQYVIKHYDKPREMLLNGTLANLFLDYDKPDQVYQTMKSLFAKQEEWSESDSHSIKRLLTEVYGLKEEMATIDHSLAVTAEAIERQVKMVPTVFINDKEFQFPVELTKEDLKKEIDRAL